MSLEGVDCFDVGDNDEDSAREDEDERNQTESADNIETHEANCEGSEYSGII